MPEKSKKSKVPWGWIMAGSKPDHYIACIDTDLSHTGTRCARMEHDNDEPEGFGTLMQMASVGPYRGKRVRMVLWLKTAKVKSWAAPWMRIDGQRQGETLSFDNFCERKISGNTDWTAYESILDVPQESTRLAFGVMLSGKGKLWLDDVSFEEVGDDVFTTDCRCSRNFVGNSLRNLDFEENEPPE